MKHQSTKFLFDKGSHTKAAIEDWWPKLQERQGDRAQLRRCDTPQAVAYLPVYFQFLSEFREAMKKDTGKDNVNPMRLQAVLGLLSHVKKSISNKSFGDLMSQHKTGGDMPRVSEARFRKILRVDSFFELYPDILRTLRLLDGEANLADMAATVYFWGEKTKRRLAYQYYGHEDILQPNKAEATGLDNA